MNLSYRHNEPEIMDDLSQKGEILDQTLKELDFINKWLGGNQITIEGIELLWKKQGRPKELHILDLGCGSGQMLVKIAQWGRKKELNLSLEGIDANPYIVKYARHHCRSYPEISIRTADIFKPDTFYPGSYHIITATLFFHHFENEDLSQLFIRHHQKAQWGWVINDLHRHWVAYWSIRLLTATLSKSPMVKNDAPLSVARSFRKKDWKQISDQTGIMYHTLVWRWAFRWLIVF